MQSLPWDDSKYRNIFGTVLSYRYRTIIPKLAARYSTLTPTSCAFDISSPFKSVHVRAFPPLALSSYHTLRPFSTDAMDEDQGIDLSRIPCDDEMRAMIPKIKKATTVESINGLKGNTESC